MSRATRGLRGDGVGLSWSGRADKRPGAASTPFDVVGLGLNCIDHLCVVERHPRFDSKQPLAQYDSQPGGQVATALMALQPGVLQGWPVSATLRFAAAAAALKCEQLGGRPGIPTLERARQLAGIG